MFEKCVLATALVMSALVLTPADADPDLWGHVRFGLDTWRWGVPRTATYSYTADGYPWINHENLSELALAFGIWAWGSAGWQIVKCVLGVTLIGMVMSRAWKNGEDTFATAAVGLVVCLNLMCHWSLRPQLFSYLLFAGMLVWLSYVFRGWEDYEETADESVARSIGRLDWLAILAPVLFAIWVNCHGGFLAGYAVFGAILVGRGLEALAYWGSRAWPIVCRLVIAVITAGSGTLVNPYGLELHRWLRYDLSMPRPEITEWHGLDWADPQSYLLVMLMVTVCGSWICGRRRLDLTHVICALLIAWQATMHRRHVAFLAIAAGLWFAPHMAGLFRRLRGPDASPEFAADVGPDHRRWCWLALAATVGALIIGLFPRVGPVRVHCADYPVSALAFMTQEKLNGKLLVTFNWAQYVLAAAGARLPQGEPDSPLTVAFDGRCRTCYSQEVHDIHFDFILGNAPGMRYRSPASPPIDGSRALRYGKPDLVLINPQQRPAVQVMERQTDWVRLYEDSTAQLWGRADRYDNPHSPYYLPEARRQFRAQPQSGYLPWPAFPT